MWEDIRVVCSFKKKTKKKRKIRNQKIKKKQKKQQQNLHKVIKKTEDVMKQSFDLGKSNLCQMSM